MHSSLRRWKVEKHVVLRGERQRKRIHLSLLEGDLLWLSFSPLLLPVSSVATLDAAAKAPRGTSGDGEASSSTCAREVHSTKARHPRQVSEHRAQFLISKISGLWIVIEEICCIQGVWCVLIAQIKFHVYFTATIWSSQHKMMYKFRVRNT